MKFILVFLLAIQAPFAQAQMQKQIFTLLLRAGPDLFKLLVEKRADLTVGVISGTVVTLGDYTLTSMFAEKPKTEPVTPVMPQGQCSSLNNTMFACKDSFNLKGERTLQKTELDKALADLGQTSLVPKAHNRMLHLYDLDSVNLRTTPEFDQKIDETVAWWSATQVNTPEAYDSYAKKFPQGGHIGQALIRGVILRTPPPPTMPCSPFESAMLEPIMNLRQAVNAKDITLFADLP